jgi:hypothetical protein
VDSFDISGFLVILFLKALEFVIFFLYQSYNIRYIGPDVLGDYRKRK